MQIFIEDGKRANAPCPPVSSMRTKTVCLYIYHTAAVGKASSFRMRVYRFRDNVVYHLNVILGGGSYDIQLCCNSLIYQTKSRFVAINRAYTTSFLGTYIDHPHRAFAGSTSYNAMVLNS